MYMIVAQHNVMYTAVLQCYTVLRMYNCIFVGSMTAPLIAMLLVYDTLYFFPLLPPIQMESFGSHLNIIPPSSHGHFDSLARTNVLCINRQQLYLHYQSCTMFMHTDVVMTKNNYVDVEGSTFTVWCSLFAP